MGEGSWVCSKNTPQQSGCCCSPLCSSVLLVLISPWGINSSSWRRARSCFDILVVVATLSCDGKGIKLGCSLGKQPLRGQPRSGYCCTPAKGEGVGKKMQLWDSQDLTVEEGDVISILPICQKLLQKRGRSIALSTVR